MSGCHTSKYRISCEANRNFLTPGVWPILVACRLHLVRCSFICCHVLFFKNEIMNKIFEAELLFAFLCHEIYWLNFCVRVQPLPGALLSTRPKATRAFLCSFICCHESFCFSRIKLWIKYLKPSFYLLFYVMKFTGWIFVSACSLYLLRCCRVGRRPRELLSVRLFVAMKAFVFQE